jgi:hypothetical protein
MYQVTFIQAGRVHAVNSPAMGTMFKLFYQLRIRGGMAARLWFIPSKGVSKLIF